MQLWVNPGKMTVFNNTLTDLHPELLWLCIILPPLFLLPLTVTIALTEISLI